MFTKNLFIYRTFCTESKKYTVVFLRHGQSIYNKEKCFSGWKDVRLSSQGIKQSIRAGKILYQNGYFFDICYTSLLTRTIQTFNYAADELHCHNIPIIKTWRLNERHYGQLQGYSKIKMNEKYGKQQLKQWRSKFEAVPPPLKIVDPKDQRSSLNDPRYQKINRSLLPQSESLKTTQQRVLPYWKDTIVPKIKQGRKVLIISHGNTLKVLFKYLNKISDQDIQEVVIPLGIPIIFHFDEKMQTLDNSYLADTQTLQTQLKKAADDGSELKDQ